MKQKIYLVYDEECPLCDNYCRMVNIRKSVGELVLINAREDNQQIKQISDRGLDIDQGMVLIIDEAYYYASEAINVLALISSNNGLFNKFNHWCFKSKRLSRITYPLLRSFRNLLLKLMGKTKIDNLSKHSSNSRF
ncbi:MAG: DCC1-like thiol-disulfide oxidoreductase family protein [Kangiellaceae bacterium]|jgi:predicted DCC family thiol-disulfide oxidoreductase YuxK